MTAPRSASVTVLHWTATDGPVVQQFDPRVLARPTRRLTAVEIAALQDLCSPSERVP